MKRKILMLLLLPILCLCFLSVGYLPIANAELTDGLIGYWNLDEGSGTDIFDSTTNNYDGTTTSTNWVTGKFLGGLQYLEGSSSYSSITNATILDSLENFTLSMWCYPQGTFDGSNNFAFRARNASDVDVISVNFKDTDKAITGSISTTNDVNRAVSANSLWFVDTWVNVVLVYNGSYVVLYADGSLVASSAVTGNLIDTASEIVLGNYGTNALALGFNGTIDDVRLYNRVLSDLEILELQTYDPNYVEPTPSPSPSPSPTPTPTATNGSISDYLLDLFFGAVWYFGFLIFILLALGLLKLWKYSGAILIPIFIIFEIQYFNRIAINPELSWAMLFCGFLILTVLAYTINALSHTHSNKE